MPAYGAGNYGRGPYGIGELIRQLYAKTIKSVRRLTR